MTYFNRGGGFGGGRDSSRPSYGGGSNRGASSYDRPEMHKAVCAECGRECEVPFKPNGSRPIYCSNCFEAQGGGKDRPQRDSRSNYEVNSRPNFGGNSRPTFDARPSYDGGERNLTSKPQSDLDLRAINIKLDRILELLTQKALPVGVADVVEAKVAKTKLIKKLIKKSLKETSEDVEA